MDTIEIEEKNSANTGLKWGGYAGAAFVLLTYILFYVLKDGRCVSWFYPYFYLPYFVMLMFMIFAGLEKRKLLGGSIDFRVAIKTTFLVLIITTIVVTVFHYFLYNNVAPTLAESEKNINLNVIENIMKAQHKSQEEIDEQINQFKTPMQTITFSNLLQIALFKIIIGFFFAALTALIVRRKPKTLNQ